MEVRDKIVGAILGVLDAQPEDLARKAKRDKIITGRLVVNLKLISISAQIVDLLEKYNKPGGFLDKMEKAVEQGDDTVELEEGDLL